MIAARRAGRLITGSLVAGGGPALLLAGASGVGVRRSARMRLLARAAAHSVQA